MGGQIVSGLTMNSQWACQVNTPLPPVYAHTKSIGNLWERRARGLQQLGGPESSNEGTSSREDCVPPHRAPNQWDAGSSGVGIGGQDEDLQVNGGNGLW